MLGCTTLINKPSFFFLILFKLKLQSIREKKTVKKIFIFFSIKKFAIKQTKELLKKLIQKYQKFCYLNEFTFKAQMWPVKFNGRPPNSLDLSISANKKKTYKMILKKFCLSETECFLVKKSN